MITACNIFRLEKNQSCCMFSLLLTYVCIYSMKTSVSLMNRNQTQKRFFYKQNKVLIGSEGFPKNLLLWKHYTNISGHQGLVCLLLICSSTMQQHNEILNILIPGCSVCCYFEAARIADEFIKDADDLFKLWPIVSLFLPAVQHQLVEHSRAVHGRR